MKYKNLPLRFNKKTQRWHDKNNKNKFTSANCDGKCIITNKCMTGLEDKENCEKNQYLKGEK